MQWFEDQNELLVTQAEDGGDTLANEGRYWFNIFVSKTKSDRNVDFGWVVSELTPDPDNIGIYVRNPRANPVVPPAKAWNDPTDVSRDQLTPMIAALGEGGHGLWVMQILRLLFKNWLRFPNGDFAGPADAGNFIRSTRSWFFWPLLLLTDLSLVAETEIRNFSPITDNSDDLNHTVLLLQAQYVYPTPVSWLARKLYKYGRGQSSGGIQAAWDEYYEHGGNNPLNVLYQDLIGKM